MQLRGPCLGELYRPPHAPPHPNQLSLPTDVWTPPRWPADVPTALYSWDMVPCEWCRWCAQHTVFGTVLCGPLPTSAAELRTVIALREAGFHVHCQEWIGYAADIVVPCARVVVEYDGEYFHRDSREHDEAQRRLAAKHGYRMIRLREPGLAVNHPDDVALPTPFGRWKRDETKAVVVAAVSSMVASRRP